MNTDNKVCWSTAFSLGRPWSFSSSALLSYDDRAFLWRMLACQFCRLRQIYNKLAAEELSFDDKELLPMPLLSRRNFHQLARLIKAVLTVNKLSHKRLDQKTINFISSSREYRPWICTSHSRDLFQYIFYADEDCAIRGSGDGSAQCCVKWHMFLFPRGESVFFRHVTKERQVLPHFSSSSHDFRNEQENCMKSPIGRKIAPMVFNGSTALDSRNIVNNLNMNSCSIKDEPTTLTDVNRRWDKSYMLDYDRKEYKKTKTVHFPDYTRLATVHRLVTYASASQFERSDRMWQYIALMERARSNNDVDSVESCCNFSSSISDDSELQHATNNLSSSSPEMLEDTISQNEVESPNLYNAPCDSKIKNSFRRARRRKRHRIKQLVESVIPSLPKSTAYINFEMCASPSNFYLDRNCSCNILY